MKTLLLSGALLGLALSLFSIHYSITHYLETTTAVRIFDASLTTVEQVSDDTVRLTIALSNRSDYVIEVSDLRIDLYASGNLFEGGVLMADKEPMTLAAKSERYIEADLRATPDTLAYEHFQDEPDSVRWRARVEYDLFFPRWDYGSNKRHRNLSPDGG